MSRVGVVIPCFKCRDQIAAVLNAIPESINHVVVVDDACPMNTGKFVQEHISNSGRVSVVFNERNLGVGGAVVAGFRALKAREPQIDIFVKVDGDGQMDPRLIPKLVSPLRRRTADYAKGNRFASYEHVRGMPPVRLFGNMILSFFSKLSTGYWQLMDPTNGFFAIHRTALSAIDIGKLSQRFFFESDLLFRLSLAKAVVVDVPLYSSYGDERSNLKIKSVILEFLLKHIRNLFKRTAYQYFVSDFSIASLQLVVGLCLTLFGVGDGLWIWKIAAETRIQTPTGTIMIPIICTILGIQILLSFLAFDILRQPSIPIQTFGNEIESED